MRFSTGVLALCLFGAPTVVQAATPRTAGVAAVKAVLNAYQRAIERLMRNSGREPEGS